MSQILIHINANILLLAINETQTHCFAVFIEVTVMPGIGFDYLFRKELFGN